MFNSIISLDNLFASWKEFQIGKKEKEDVLLFEHKLEDNNFMNHCKIRLTFTCPMNLFLCMIQKCVIFTKLPSEIEFYIMQLQKFLTLFLNRHSFTILIRAELTKEVIEVFNDLFHTRDAKAEITRNPVGS